MQANVSVFSKYQAWAYAIGASVIFFVSIPYGTGGWGMSDKIYLGMAVFGLFLWWGFHSAWYAFVFAMTVDGIGILPIIKAKGAGESRVAWTLWFVGCLANIAGMMKISDKALYATNPALADIIYPITMSAIVVVPTTFVWHWNFTHRKQFAQ